MSSDFVAQRLIGPGSPFELTSRTSGRGECKVYRHAPATFSELYSRALKRTDKDFVAFGSDRLTFRQVWFRAAGVAQLLRHAWSVRQGVKVAITLGNGEEWLIAFLAVTMLGAVPVLVGRRSAGETLNCLDASGSSLVIADAGQIPVGANAALDSGDGDNHVAAPWLDVRDLAASAVEAAHPAPIDNSASADDLAVVLFTSGSTGTPKAVALSHLNVMSGLMNMMLASALAFAEDPDRASSPVRRVPCGLIHSPLSHIGGMSAVLLAIYSGSRIVITDGWNAEAIHDAIKSENVTALPQVGKRQLDDLLRSPDSIASLSSIGLHGARMPTVLANELCASFPALRLVSGYGMTETAGSIAVISGRTLRERPGSSGRVVPSVETRVLKNQAKTEAPGHSGQLLVSGACTMLGYLNPELAPVAGWFDTGDVAHLSSDGHLYIHHRGIECSVLSSRGISVADVENRLTELRGVSEVSLFARAREENLWLGVAIEVSPGSEVDRRLVEQALTPIVGATAEVQIHLCETFPRTESGKVNRAELQASLADGEGARRA